MYAEHFNIRRLEVPAKGVNMSVNPPDFMKGNAL